MDKLAVYIYVSVIYKNRIASECYYPFYHVFLIVVHVKHHKIASAVHIGNRRKPAYGNPVVVVYGRTHGYTLYFCRPKENKHYQKNDCRVNDSPQPFFDLSFIFAAHIVLLYKKGRPIYQPSHIHPMINPLSPMSEKHRPAVR